MNNFLALFLIFFMALPCCAETLDANTQFNWVSKSQKQRESDIIDVKQILLTDKSIPDSYSKQTFKDVYAPYLEDSESNRHFYLAKNGVKETEDYRLAGFFKGSILFMYGIQYKSDLTHIYYYDAFGKLRFVDVISSNYPKFPYFSKQFKSSGKCIAVFYYLSETTQFIYSPKYVFKGVWEGLNMYDVNAKKLITRSNY